jgi:integrating conjugative element protein (TIGR03749 family)
MRVVMRTKIRYVLAMASLLAVITPYSAKAEQRVVYSGRPVSLTLTVGHEQRVVFPEPVYIDLPQRLAQATASLQPEERVVYLTGKTVLPAQRIIATATSGEHVYLVDLQIVEDGPLADYRIESPALMATTPAAENQPAASPRSPGQRPRNPPQVELLRHAAQTLYAPARLQPTHSQIRRAPTPDYPAGVSLIPSTKGETFSYRIIGAWRGFGRYLTAVEVINRSDLLIELDPRLVRGAFDAVAFQHPWVGRSGSLEDRTTLYLISQNPFDVSAQGMSYGR